METNIVFIGLISISLVVMGFILIRSERDKTRLSQKIIEFSEMAQKLAQEQAQNSANTQAELKGRIEQSQTNVNERFEALSKRIGDGLVQQTEKTGITLKQLHERLAARGMERLCDTTAGYDGPLKPNYIWRGEANNYYTIEQLGPEWSGRAKAIISDIEFSE